MLIDEVKIHIKVYVALKVQVEKNFTCYINLQLIGRVVMGWEDTKVKNPFERGDNIINLHILYRY